MKKKSVATVVYNSGLPEHETPADDLYEQNSITEIFFKDTDLMKSTLSEYNKICSLC